MSSSLGCPDTFEVIACNLCGGTSPRLVLCKGNPHPAAGREVVRCTACGLIFVSPRPPRALVEGQYRDLAGQTYYLEKFYLPILEKVRPFFVDRLVEAESWRAGAPAGRLLDIGCGPGVLLEVAAERGWQVAGVDPSPAAARYVRARGIPVQECALDEAVLTAGAFDVVTLLECLEHLPNPRDALVRAATAAAPTGLVGLTTPNWNCLTRYVIGARWEVIAPSAHLYYFTARTLRRILQNVGLEVLSIKTSGLRWIHRRPRLRRLAERLGLGETLLVWARKPADAR